MPSVALTSSLRRGLQILEAFTPSSPRIRLCDVVEKTKMPKATALRFLRTLMELDYVSYDSRAKVYWLTPRVMSLGYTVLSGIDVREVAVPFMAELSSTLGQSVNLAVLDGTEIVYIERIAKRRILNIDLHVGTRLNAYQTALGQVILAFMREAERGPIIRRLRQDPEIAPHLGPNGKRIRSKLKEIQERGYALNDEEYNRGLRAIAAPVFDHEGVVDAAINVAVFAHLVTRDDLIEKYVPPLLNTARQISAARGFRQALRYEQGALNGPC